MRRPGQGIRHAGLADRFAPVIADALKAVAGYVRKTVVVTELETRKLRHDPTELITRAIQPTLWLLVFGQVLSRTRAIPTGSLSYMTFMAPGILAQSVLFIAIFFGIAIIWERDLGVVHKLLATPTPRTALVLGKALSAGVRALSQVVVVYLLALLVGVKINWSLPALAGVLGVVILGAAFFSSLSLIIACVVKTRERFMGIGQILTMPLFFASNAIYPISMMPGWLQVMAHINPLTYEVDALRALMVVGGASVFGVGADIGILLAATMILVIIGGWMYPNVAI